MEFTAVQIAFVMLLFTAGAALAALLRLVNTSTESVRKEMIAEMERRDALNSKARHDGNNRIASDMLKLEAQVETLKRETVRREDVAAIENRLAQLLARLDGKMDMVTERLSHLTVMEKQVGSMERRIDMALRRLERAPSPGGELDAA